MTLPAWQIWQGNALERLRDVPDRSVQCTITSPPFYGLRDYGTGRWEGGSSSCGHPAPLPGGTRRSGLGDYGNHLSQEMIDKKVAERRQQYRRHCRHCGATRVDEQLGLEPTPGEFVEQLVVIFREVKRVLRDDGTLWLNLGDSYASHGGQRGSGKGPGLGGTPQHMRGQPEGHRLRPAGYKRKDLMGIPWMVALALRADGWYLRSDVIWEKPNTMPESVKDRPTMSHEYLFLLSKSRRYHYDGDAVREPDKGRDHERHVKDHPHPGAGVHPPNKGIRARNRNGDGRNKRSVWSIPTIPYKGAHYATFPPRLIEPCVLACARRGDIVLDPFVGTGVTLMVAAQHGRRALGIELNPESIDLAKARVNKWLSDHPPTVHSDEEQQNGGVAEALPDRVAIHDGGALDLV